MKENGSVLVYILIGIVLFVVLAAALTNMSRSSIDFADAEQSKLGAQALLDYAGKAKLVVQNMKLSGVETSALLFMKDGQSGYGTAPHTAKVFHPSGGALAIPNWNNVLDKTDINVNNEDIVYMSRISVDDIGTTADDVVLSVAPVRKDVCETINKQITGSKTIPSVTGGAFADVFGTPDAGDPLDVSRETACAQMSSENFYVFFSVLDRN